MDHLLDTNIIVDYFRGQSSAANFLNQLKSPPTISVVTVAELYQGARRLPELNQLHAALQPFTVLPIIEPISHDSLKLIENFTLSHHLLFLDALIAATAIHHHLSLATLNTKHFRMIPNLKVTKPY
jgi:tRNA(fMet)-specific endonuclease VapC